MFAAVTQHILCLELSAAQAHRDRFLQRIGAWIARRLVTRKGIRKKAEQGIWRGRAPPGDQNVPGPYGKIIWSRTRRGAMAMFYFFAWLWWMLIFGMYLLGGNTLTRGLKPWPRLFHAMRASRETELAKDDPIHVVTAWLGNTPRIAMKHYLQVTDDDFERAAQGGAECGAARARLTAHALARNDKSPCGNKGLCEWVRYRARVCHGIERRGQDSNLRTSCPVTDLANPRFRPLSHLSCERPLIVQHQRLACKRASAASEYDACQLAVFTSPSGSPSQRLALQSSLAKLPSD